MSRPLAPPACWNLAAVLASAVLVSAGWFGPPEFLGRSVGPGFGQAQAADDPAAPPIVEDVPLQPLAAQVERLAQALDEMLAQPLSEADRAALKRAAAADDEAAGTAAIQKILDRHVLAVVEINPESRVKVAAGPAERKLHQHGWQSFLVKVHNEAQVTAPLRCQSPHAPVLKYSSAKHAPDPPPMASERDRWLAIDLFEKQPLNPALSGLPLEYRIVSLYARDAGPREARLTFDVGQGTQDLGFRNELSVLFQCRPAVEVKLDVRDVDGRPAMAGFVFRDAQGRVYPSRLRREEPDFFFHDQVYRQTGESVLLPPGEYEVTYGRGPEYRQDVRKIVVAEPPLSAGASSPQVESFPLRRWIHMARRGWYSGDHHVHAAGCKHFDSPTQGVTPASMMRHILGEDLNVGCVLTWGPCWYHQKQFFSGKISELSQPEHLMRYDIEVSGFPSSHAGHLCLLNLEEDDYPGTEQVEDWPSWDLPILQWGQKQGGVVGFAHSGWGLKVAAQSLPTFEMPPFDSIGANEYVVDVAHGACDFISAVDTPFVWEMNVWYHTLNCGFDARISGETDFPCIYGERVGLGRGYVKIPGDAPLNWKDWVAGIRDGRSYCTDGYTHLFDFTVNDLGVGERADGDENARPSYLTVQRGRPLEIQVQAASLLAEEPREEIRKLRLDERPYWHVERARIGDSRKVAVELIVNGEAVETQEIQADGDVRSLKFSYTPQISSWVALRVFPSCHTNPVFVEVDGQPIRASRRSAQWCLDAVNVCWQQKEPRIRDSEKAAAAEAYEAARATYRQILEASQAD